jgi:hypothetical protein
MTKVFDMCALGISMCLSVKQRESSLSVDMQASYFIQVCRLSLNIACINIHIVYINLRFNV